MKHLPLRLFLATAVALSLAAAEDLDLVRTPFGTKPRACVLEVRGGSTAEDALSSYEVPPICSEPRFRTAPTRRLTAPGAPPSNLTCDAPPCTCDSLPCNNWINNAGYMMTGNRSLGGFSARYTVPSTPTGDGAHGQTLFYFIGAENTDGIPRHGGNGVGRTIFQPVLTYDPSGWCVNSTTGWCMSSWNCCPKDVATHSEYITEIHPGDEFFGMFNLTADGNFEVLSRNTRTGEQTLLRAARGGRSFNWADVTLEVYGITACDQFAGGPMKFGELKLWDESLSPLSPEWLLTSSNKTGCEGRIALDSSTGDIAIEYPHAHSAKPNELPLPRWKGPVPDPQVNASAGLPLIRSAKHVTVYNATIEAEDGGNGAALPGPNPFGTYNHGPIITHYDGLYWMSWYNSPRDESAYMRSVYATSEDGEVWSTPRVLFPNLTHNGQENGPWATINGRLYTQTADHDAGLHYVGQGLMRRVSRDGLGEPFWLNATVPPCCTSWGFKTFLEMDGVTRADASQYLGSAVSTLIGIGADEMKYNERSLYRVPGTRQLVNLLRGAGPQALTATTCELPPPTGGTVPGAALAASCRPGVGDVFFNLVELVNASGLGPEPRPRTCNWSAPVIVTLPDSHSRTCAATLPSGGIFLVGNQISKGRDPVTLAVARDGLLFDRQWAVRAGAPPVRYPGHAKGVGFQYPGALVLGDEMLVSYSIGKEDIGLTRFPLTAIGESQSLA